MKFLKLTLLLLSFILFFNNCPQNSNSEKTSKILTEIPKLDITFIPEKYIAYKSEVPITIDGELTDAEWGNLEWTKEFSDLEGDKKPVPL